MVETAFKHFKHWYVLSKTDGFNHNAEILSGTFNFQPIIIKPAMWFKHILMFLFQRTVLLVKMLRKPGISNISFMRNIYTIKLEWQKS